MGRKKGNWVANVLLFGWVRRQSMRVKAVVAVALGLFALVALKFLIKDQTHFFVTSQTAHLLGICVLIYKLTIQKNCSGLSLKSQELTAIYLAVRLYCNFPLEAGILSFLDFATLISTLWVIYMIRFKLKSTYIKELDNFPIYFTVIPSVILAFLVHPYVSYKLIDRMLLAFCVYMESVSVLPQLLLMQNAKMVETFTGHYVFALGVARFFVCTYWIFQVIESRKHFIRSIGDGYLWPTMVIFTEIVQTFILADFCYYYIKSAMYGQLLVRLPSSAVQKVKL